MTNTHTHRIELNFHSIKKGRGGTIKKGKQQVSRRCARENFSQMKMREGKVLGPSHGKLSECFH